MYEYLKVFEDFFLYVYILGIKDYFYEQQKTPPEMTHTLTKIYLKMYVFEYVFKPANK